MHKAPNDQWLIEYLCVHFNEATRITERTLTIGDRTLHFNPQGEIWKITFEHEGKREVVYP